MVFSEQICVVSLGSFILLNLYNKYVGTMILSYLASIISPRLSGAYVGLDNAKWSVTT